MARAEYFIGTVARGTFSRRERSIVDSDRADQIMHNTGVVPWSVSRFSPSCSRVMELKLILVVGCVALVCPWNKAESNSPVSTCRSALADAVSDFPAVTLISSNIEFENIDLRYKWILMGR